MFHDLEELKAYWPKAQYLPSLPANYELLNAIDKQEILIKQYIEASEYTRLPPLKPIDLPGLFFTPLRMKMDRQADVIPDPWTKAIHAHGSVATVSFISVNDHPYTGLFKGAKFGLIRLSLTADPGPRGVAPGFALKLFVDQHRSANVSALVSLTGQGKNYNIFANDYSNIVPFVLSPGPLLINSIFLRASRYPTKLSLSEIARIDQHGVEAKEPVYPSQVVFMPNPDLGFSGLPHDFRADLAKLPPGTLLFYVYAGPSADESQRIGELRTTSRFIASAFGDSQLFFQHVRFR